MDDIASLKTPSFCLCGRSALVSGASRGLGAAAAAALAQAGASVTAIARSEEIHTTAAKINKTIDKKMKERGGGCRGVVLDVLDEKATSALVETGDELKNKKQPYSILISNAGTNIPQLATQVTTENFDAVFNLNVRASFFISTAFARALIKARSNGFAQTGSVVQVSSQMGHVGAPKRSVYCASKHAVQGFVKCMAWEWGSYNIRINALCPTFINTPLTRPMLEDKKFLNVVLQNIALGRVGEMQEIMGAIVFLASDASSLVTGSSLMADGGWTAR